MPRRLTHAEEALEVGEELDIETESGLLLIIKITALDEETEKASFEIVLNTTEIKKEMAAR